MAGKERQQSGKKRGPKKEQSADKLHMPNLGNTVLWGQARGPHAWQTRSN